MLATAKRNGWPLESYPAPEHPMQRAAAHWVERLAGRRARRAGVDGCGVQTFAFDLVGSACAFEALAVEGREVLDVMASQPFLVAGTGRLCTALMEAVPDLGVKIGAEGLGCGVLREKGLGFALKARDGTNRARDVAIVALLEMLGVFEGGPPDELAPYAAPAVEGGGRPVGVVRCRGSLKQA
jgi:L-asparaginase II